MPRIDIPPRNKDEKIELSFLGFKFKCANPSAKTVIIVALILAFFALLLFLVPKGIVKWFSG